MEAIRSGTLVDRMIGAATLDDGTYEEIESDGGAATQAAMVVFLGIVAGGIGVALSGPIAFTLGIFFAVIGSVAYAYAAYWAATRWFKKPAAEIDRGELLRILGFATSPLLLLILGLIPVLGAALTLVAYAWVLITTVVAIRHALDFDIRSALGTAAAAWCVLFVVRFLFGVV
ncbi:MAG TPA: YIP1 family protein, partial [Dehalococcoidia bacterium]|nr:YIP1 family protein [Dehalococcoidia bacterium]